MFTTLLLPAFISAVVVFFASFLIWMVIKWHDKDIKPLPDEQAFTDQLAKLNLPGGAYMWPHIGPDATAESRAAANQRWKTGPWGSMNIIGPRAPSFARNLVVAFLVYLAISFATAGVLYYAYLAQETDVQFMDIAWLAWVVSVPAYCLGGVPQQVFFGYNCRFITTHFLDGLIFGVLTGLTFAILW